MAKLNLRRRGVYGKRGAHETNRFVAHFEDTRVEYVLRSDNVLLKNRFWRSGYDGSPQSTGWKVVKRHIDPEAIIKLLVSKGYTQ